MKNKAFLKYIFAQLLFGTNGIVASFILLDSMQIVFFRTLIGSALLTLLFLFSGEKFTFYQKKKDFLSLVISGVAMGASWMFLYEGYARVGVSISSLLYYCGPVFVISLSPILFKERLSMKTILSFALVVCGVVLINGNLSPDNDDPFGILCGILSAVTYAFMVIYNKKAKGIEGLENSSLQLIIAMITTSVFLGIKQGFSMEITKESVLPILILGVINTGFGCFLFFSSIGKLKVQTVSIFGYLELLSAVVFSVIFLKETMTIPQIIGAFLILSGAIYCEISGIDLKKGK